MNESDKNHAKNKTSYADILKGNQPENTREQTTEGFERGDIAGVVPENTEIAPQAFKQCVPSGSQHVNLGIDTVDGVKPQIHELLDNPPVMITMTNEKVPDAINNNMHENGINEWNANEIPSQASTDKFTPAIPNKNFDPFACNMEGAQAVVMEEAKESVKLNVLEHLLTKIMKAIGFKTLLTVSLAITFLCIVFLFWKTKRSNKKPHFVLKAFSVLALINLLMLLVFPCAKHNSAVGLFFAQYSHLISISILLNILFLCSTLFTSTKIMWLTKFCLFLAIFFDCLYFSLFAGFDYSMCRNFTIAASLFGFASINTLFFLFY